jgi:hypothetical protein
MTEKENHKTVFFVIISLISVMILCYTLGGGLETTGQSVHHGNMISASGTFSGGSGTGNIQITFPEEGGTASGQLNGRYAQGSATSTYSGQIYGTYYGGEGGQLIGTMKGTGEVRMGSRIQRGPFNGQFNGIVSLTRGTVTGSWSGTQMGGPFTLTFTPRRGVPQTGTLSTTQPATLGYCRCITGERTSGIETSPYGGTGMRYQGIMTMQNCINKCGFDKYSWRER